MEVAIESVLRVLQGRGVPGAVLAVTAFETKTVLSRFTSWCWIRRSLADGKKALLLGWPAFGKFTSVEVSTLDILCFL